MDIATGIMVLCAVSITLLVVRREFGGSRNAGYPRPDVVAGWQRFGEAGHRTGPREAPVTIVSFSDFQCPACRTFERTLAELQETHPHVAVVYRHLPLQTHSHARQAAHASECAALQGGFEAYRNLLFAKQDSIGSISWAEFAQRAGVPDVDAFVRCSDGGGAEQALVRDSIAAAELGARATPTFLLNGLKFQGALPPTELARYVAGETRGR